MLGELPVELALGVIAMLDYDDVLAVRVCSRAHYQLVTTNQAQIAREQLARYAPDWLVDLFPRWRTQPFGPVQTPLTHLTALRRRIFICASLSLRVADYVTREMCNRRSSRQRREFAAQHHRMWSRMMTPLLLLFRHFELMRLLSLEHVERHGPSTRWLESRERSLLLLGSMERSLLLRLEPRALLDTAQMFLLLVGAFKRRLRPPSYAGRIERSMRGWRGHCTGPSDAGVAQVLLIGGLEQMERVWTVKAYGERRAALDEWLAGLQTPGPDGADGGGGKKGWAAAFRRKGSSSSASGVTAAAAGARQAPEGYPMPPLPQAQAHGLWDAVGPNRWRLSLAAAAESVLLGAGCIASPLEIKRPVVYIKQLLWTKEEGDTEDDVVDGEGGGDGGSEGSDGDE